MNKLVLLINTVKHLKWQQVYFRLVRKVTKPKVTDNFNGLNKKKSHFWEHITLYEEKIDSDLNAFFLNKSKKLELPDDWNNKDFSKLWVYNLHYFEDLLAKNAEEKYEFHLHLLKIWVDQNPVGYGNGWEPYPTSLRIVNTLKAWLGGLELDKKLLNSVFVQASFLSNNLEKHLLGNHYFVNLKALLFAGIIFENTRWIIIAERGLLEQIPEQILKDGSNFELSPMYHSLMLVDMLDILNLIRSYPEIVSTKLVSLLDEYIPKMIAFMEAMAHPDGGVSFFNDSSDGIAPKKDKIESYAMKLGFKIKHLNLNKSQIIDNVNSGYICATAFGNKLIFDASPIGPDYIPGHAHADTLSFEFSIGNQRVFVNSGISEYGLSSKRLNQRKTMSHNTIEVDGRDSSQVWSGFRVANRAKIVSRHAAFKNFKSIVLQGSHNGYKSLFGGCIHARKLIYSEDSIVLSDSLLGRNRYARSRFHFHPNLKIYFENNLLKIIGDRFILQSNLAGKAATITNSNWNPEFGVEIPNKVLEVNLENSELEIEFTWSKR